MFSGAKTLMKSRLLKISGRKRIKSENLKLKEKIENLTADKLEIVAVNLKQQEQIDAIKADNKAIKKDNNAVKMANLISSKKIESLEAENLAMKEDFNKRMQAMEEILANLEK